MRRIATICALVAALFGAGCAKKEEPTELTHGQVVRRLTEAKEGAAYHIFPRAYGDSVEQAVSRARGEPEEKRWGCKYSPEDGLSIENQDGHGVVIPEVTRRYSDVNTDGMVDYKRVRIKLWKDLSTIERDETTETEFKIVPRTVCDSPLAAQKGTRAHADCVMFRTQEEGQKLYERVVRECLYNVTHQHDLSF